MGVLLTVSSVDGRAGNFGVDSFLWLALQSFALSAWLPGFKAAVAAVSKELLMSSKLDLLTRRLLLSSTEHGGAVVEWEVLVVLDEIDVGAISLSRIFDSVLLTRAGEAVSLRQGEQLEEAVAALSVVVAELAVHDLD